jgi:hypothetical protein
MPPPAVGATQVTRICPPVPVHAVVGLAGVPGGPGVAGAVSSLGPEQLLSSAPTDEQASTVTVYDVPDSSAPMVQVRPVVRQEWMLSLATAM